MTLDEARAELERGRKVTHWHIDKACLNARGDPKFVELCTASATRPNYPSPAFSSEDAAVSQFLEHAQRATRGFSAIEWCAEPIIERYGDGWSLYARWACFHPKPAAA